MSYSLGEVILLSKHVPGRKRVLHVITATMERYPLQSKSQLLVAVKSKWLLNSERGGARDSGGQSTPPPQEPGNEAIVTHSTALAGCSGH